MALKIERNATKSNSSSKDAGFSTRRATTTTAAKSSAKTTKTTPSSKTTAAKSATEVKPNTTSADIAPVKSTAPTIAVTSSYMNIQVQEPGSVTVDQLLENEAYKLPIAVVAKRKASVDLLNENLELQQAELKATENYIKLQIGQQRVAKTAYDYSTAVSQTEDAKNRAEYNEEKTGLNKQIRSNRIQILKGEEAKTRHQAAKAKSYVQAYANDVIDVEYS